MTELTLTWMGSAGPRSEIIYPQQPRKNPGTVRLGRDPRRCDIVLSDDSVSGLHIEIFYDAARGGFYVRSLRDSNPPVINGQLLRSGEVPLGSNNTIQLGRLQIRATSAMPASETLGGVPPTNLVVPPTTPQSPYSSLQRPANTPASNGAPEHRGIRKYIEAAKAILVSPVLFFHSARNNVDTGEARKYLYILLIPGAILSYFMNLLIPFSGIINVTVNEGQPGPAGLLIGHVIIYCLIPLLFYLAAALEYLLLIVPSKIFGAQMNYAKAYCMLAYSLTPGYLLGSFPYIKILASIWSFILFIIAYREYCHTSTLRAIGVIVSSFAICYAIILIIFRSLLFPFG